MTVLDETLLKKVICPRPEDSHKGDYGRVLLVGGTYPYGGAIIMAALATVRSGAGLVTVATDRDNIPALHAHLPEAMAFDLGEKERLAEQVAKAHVVLIGPGLAEDTRRRTSLEIVLARIKSQQILILDGGALSLFAQGDLPFPKGQLVFTPHQREWERLSGLAISQQTRAASQQVLDTFPAGTILVQKKHGTEIFQSQHETVYQLRLGGPYQATGGMGDTLAGMIAGFVGQFGQSSLLDRVLAATYLHSAIADQLSQEAYVVLPTEISKLLPRWLKDYSQD